MCAADFPDFARPGPPPGQIELAQGWALGLRHETSRADGASPVPAGLSRRRAGTRSPECRPPSCRPCKTDGTYPDLYVGTNLLDDVPQDLYKQDWWYRTTFTAPAGHTTYVLEFPGINYRAEIWLNGHLVADNKRIVGMHSAHELDVSPWVNRGGSNTLAVKITPGAGAAGRQRC